MNASIRELRAGFRLRAAAEAAHETSDAVYALGLGMEGWRHTVPTPGAISNARIAIQGIDRLLSELQMAVTRPPEAA